MSMILISLITSPMFNDKTSPKLNRLKLITFTFYNNQSIRTLQRKHKQNHEENVLNFEEKKAKILEDAKETSTEDFLASKGIKREE